MSARLRRTSMNGAPSHTPAVSANIALAALPHAPPFRFVSEVTALEPARRAEGVWRVQGDEDFLRGHFPGSPIVPGVLIGEALAQLSGIVCSAAGHPNGPIQGRLARIEIKLLHAVVPPAEILLCTELARSLASLHQFSVEARVKDIDVARGTLTLAMSTESIEAGPWT